MKNIIFILLLIIFSCGNNEPREDVEEKNIDHINNQDKQLNISILLDLSDRVVKEMQPSQVIRDIAIINKITDMFKSDMEKKGAYMSKQKLRVLFTPAPADPNINNISKKLRIDLSKTEIKNKKDIFDNVKTDFESAIQEIYKLTIESRNWIGSDIWRFFKNDVVDFCVESDNEYRNILIIVTDGYIYHKQSFDRIENKTTYITPVFIQKEGFRNNSNWLEQFNKQKFGLLSERQDLNNLEILVLEINPSNNHRNDEDIIKTFISKWFEEMNVQSFSIYNTSLPENTATRIENFFK